MFTLPHTEIEKETDEKWVIKDCVELTACSYCTETDTNAESHWVLCYLSVSASVSGNVNETVLFRFVVTVHDKDCDFAGTKVNSANWKESDQERRKVPE